MGAVDDDGPVETADDWDPVALGERLAWQWVQPLPPLAFHPDDFERMKTWPRDDR